MCGHILHRLTGFSSKRPVPCSCSFCQQEQTLCSLIWSSDSVLLCEEPDPRRTPAVGPACLCSLNHRQTSVLTSGVCWVVLGGVVCELSAGARGPCASTLMSVIIRNLLICRDDINPATCLPDYQGFILQLSALCIYAAGGDGRRSCCTHTTGCC